MWKWIGRLLVVCFVGYCSLLAYDLYRGGYFAVPDLEDDEYPISFKSGFRAIIAAPVAARPMNRNSKYFRRLAYANPDRKYLGIPYDVPSWFEDAWSYCETPAEGETNAILNTMPEDMRRDLISARLDGICTIDSDGEKILRGLLFSVPKL